jgi:hypothetical protein
MLCWLQKGAITLMLPFEAYFVLVVLRSFSSNNCALYVQNFACQCVLQFSASLFPLASAIAVINGFYHLFSLLICIALFKEEFLAICSSLCLQISVQLLESIVPRTLNKAIIRQ